MRTRILTASMLILALAAMTFSAGSARAHDDRPGDGSNADRIFEQCVRHLRTTVERCDHRTAETTKSCLMRIRRLCEAGQKEEARRVAHQCIREIERDTNQCVDHVRRVCQRCIHALREAGAPELARRLHGICENAVEHLRKSQRRAVNAIREAIENC